MNTVKVKNAQIFYSKYNQVNRYFGKITGYGPSYIVKSGLLETEIENPTGLQPAVFFTTGTLTGLITNGGSFTWSNLRLTGSGQQNMVYLNYVTGAIQATGQIYFNESLLTEDDTVSINNVSFTYKENPVNITEFSSADDLINKLNFGATGGYNNINNTLEIVGVTGYKQDNVLTLFAYRSSGDLGNDNLIYRECVDLNSIIIPHKYFRGGQFLRPLASRWTGLFTNDITLTVENTGIYSEFISRQNIVKIISGIKWANNFNNYNINTGFLNPVRPGDYSGVNLTFNSNLNIYSGKASFPIPSKKNQIQILNIDIKRYNPYNTYNLIKYIITGDDFAFSGLLEG